MVLHGKVRDVALAGFNPRLEKDQEWVLAIIYIINRKIESRFERAGFLDGPIHRKVKPVVRVHAVLVAAAILGHDRAHVEVITERHRHGVARLEYPQTRDRQLVTENLVRQADGNIVATVIFRPEGFPSVQVIELPAGERQRVTDEAGKPSLRLLYKELRTSGSSLPKNVQLIGIVGQHTEIQPVAVFGEIIHLFII